MNHTVIYEKNVVQILYNRIFTVWRWLKHKRRISIENWTYCAKKCTNFKKIPEKGFLDIRTQQIFKIISEIKKEAKVRKNRKETYITGTNFANEHFSSSSVELRLKTKEKFGHNASIKILSAKRKLISQKTGVEKLCSFCV